MLCPYCQMPFRYKNFVESKYYVIYNWTCPKCGHSKKTKETK